MLYLWQLLSKIKSMARKFFTNREGNTLMKQFEGLLENNPNIKNLDCVVGFLRASGYFTLRPFLNSINKVRMLIGIDVDKPTMIDKEFKITLERFLNVARL